MKEGEIHIEDEQMNVFTIKKILRHSDKNVDLIKIITKEEFNFFPYSISNQVQLAEKVIIFGYPPIPLTSKPFLIANLGEVSAEVDNYLDKTDCIILSSITRPGNSGGPVINEYGKLVGIMVQNRYTKFSLTWQDSDDVDLNRGLGYATALKAKYINEI